MKKEKVILHGKKFFKHPFFSGYAASKHGEILNTKMGRILKCSINKVSGYKTFSLFHDMEMKTYSCHRFVYECIKGVIPENYVVDHVDSCRTNNSISNLQLLSSKENIQKARNRKVVALNLETEEEKTFDSLTLAAKELKMYVGSVCCVCREKTKSAKSKVTGQKYSFRYAN